jgi:hypothetical protein
MTTPPPGGENDRPSSHPLHHPHELAPTTHVLELEQLDELNARLPERNGSLTVTAGDLAMDAAQHPGSPLQPENALVGLDWDGPPQFPYIHGLFTVPGHAEPVMVELHTAALRELSRRAGLRHTWGV